MLRAYMLNYRCALQSIEQLHVICENNHGNCYVARSVQNIVHFFKLQQKKDLMEAVRRTNPASVTTAPLTFWDVEGSLKTVSILSSLFKILCDIQYLLSVCYRRFRCQTTNDYSGKWCQLQ